MQFLLPNKSEFIGTYFCLDCKVSIDKVAVCPYLLSALVYITTKRTGLPFCKGYEKRGEL